MMPASIQGLDSTAAVRMKIYLFFLPVAAFAAFFAWTKLDLPAQKNLYEKYSLLAITAWLLLCWSGLLLSRWVPFRTVEGGIFWGTALLMVLNIYYNLLSVAEEGLWPSSVWIAMVFVLAYFVFEPRTAWRVSLGIFTAFGAVGIMALAPRVAAGAPIDTNAVLQLYISQLCYLVYFRLLILAKEHALQAQSKAIWLYQLAHTDPLTGVANRRSIVEAMYRALEHHNKTKEPLSLVLLDLDHFKKVNDQYGHETGDKVLVHVARLMRQNLRQDDLLGRWGGEEFVLLLSNTSLQDAQELCSRLRQVLAENPLEPLHPVSASFGIASAIPGDTTDRLISRADAAMYLSKQAGGNRIEVVG